MTTKITIDTTKRGFPAMWESGGGMTSGGSATIITGRNGEPRRPIYMPRGGHLACGNHALIGVDKGFHVVTASVRRGERESATIRRIVATSVKDVNGEKFEATAEVEVLNTFSRGEWDKPIDEKLAPAVEAAFRKSGSYHCRSAYFIDSSEKPAASEGDQKRKAEEMRRQDEERAKLRQAKADADARAKAEAESASKAAKDAGLGVRLEAVNARLTALGREVVELGEVSFKWSWQTQLYSEENVARVERHVEQSEAEIAEKQRRQATRDAFQPKFEALKPRTEALGLTVEFGEESVRLGDYYYGDTYSEDGLAKFEAKIVQKEQEAVEARRRADAEAKQAVLEAEAAAMGLPQNVEIWKRRGGSTDAGDGWVIRPDGSLRERDEIDCPRPRYSEEGTQRWRQICRGELVIKWSKAYTAAPHEFTVVHRPETLTPAQERTVRLIQEELAEQWDGRRGMSGVSTSPPVGNGWGLNSPKPKPTDPGKLDLSSLFGGAARVSGKPQ
ncbi:hypothetical protein EPN81_04895 [Patescibacteria group bacterium]|nr:MAG: hypothetical protein EPN81_04895 [Patescibacteria group bacterium]